RSGARRGPESVLRSSAAGRVDLVLALPPLSWAQCRSADVHQPSPRHQGLADRQLRGVRAAADAGNGAGRADAVALAARRTCAVRAAWLHALAVADAR